MNRIVTLSTMPAAIAVVVSILFLSQLGAETAGPWQWCVIGLAAMAVVLLVALLFNFAVFAPVYWLLGKRQSRKK
jgi:hypothetical protein